MGPRHHKEEILGAAVATAFAEGLHRLTFGRVARRLGTSDRMVVYYFPTTSDLIGAVLLELGGRLQESLASALTTPAADHVALLRALWPRLARPDADPVFALFFEAIGLAAAGREPYRDLVPLLVAGWVAWAADALEGTDDDRRVEAETAVAIIDGLLLLRQVAGPAAANRAAGRIGIR